MLAVFEIAVPVEEAKCLVSFVSRGKEYGAFSGAGLGDEADVRSIAKRILHGKGATIAADAPCKRNHS